MCMQFTLHRLMRLFNCKQNNDNEKGMHKPIFNTTKIHIELFKQNY